MAQQKCHSQQKEHPSIHEVAATSAEGLQSSMIVNPTNRHIKPTTGQKHEREVSMKHQIPR
jgi:hypothetical protein